MVHFQRFMWPSPNLISIEEFRHLARALSTLLRKASKSASYCSSRLFVSPWQLEYILHRGMPSHSSFQSSFFYTVPFIPQVRLGRIMFVSLTLHAYFMVISLTFSQPFNGSRTVLSLPDSLKIPTARDYIRRLVTLSIAVIVCIATPTVNASGCGRYTLHSPHPSLSSGPIRLFSD